LYPVNIPVIVLPLKVSQTTTLFIKSDKYLVV